MVIMTNILLQKSIPYEEFDYQTLLDSIQGYARPRMKISGMLAKGFRIVTANMPDQLRGILPAGDIVSISCYRNKCLNVNNPCYTTNKYNLVRSLYV
jgi:hypothetical protein